MKKALDAVKGPPQFDERLAVPYAALRFEALGHAVSAVMLQVATGAEALCP